MRSAPPPGLATARRVYAALLVFYPRDARRREREDLLSFFEDRYRDAWRAGG